MTEPPTKQHGPRSTALAYMELVRLPNVFTAMADVAMGFLFVRSITGPRDAGILALLLLASSLLYTAGMVLNDLFDFDVDARERPGRPLPSGRVSRRAARLLGCELLLLGAAAAWAASFVAGGLTSGVVAGILIGCILLYDAWLKRTPLGSLAMGGCRMLNVLLGMSVATGPWTTAHWLVAGGIGSYIVGVTWFARTEARTSSRLQLTLATAIMLLGIAILGSFAGWREEVGPMRLQRWRILMTVLGLLIGWRCLRAVLQPVPARVQMVVKHGILSLVILDASVCYVTQGPTAAMAVLALLVPTVVLGRWVYST